MRAKAASPQIEETGVIGPLGGEGASASTVEREHPDGRGGVPRGGDTYVSLRGSHRGQRLGETRATLMKVEIRLRFTGR